MLRIQDQNCIGDIASNWQLCSAYARNNSFSIVFLWYVRRACFVDAMIARCLVIYYKLYQLSMLPAASIPLSFPLTSRFLFVSFLFQQPEDIDIFDYVLRDLRSSLKSTYLECCNASGLMHCLCRKYIQSLSGSCFGKFSLLCFNSCCACLLTSGFSFVLVGKSRTISRITIQKCTGKFQCTGGSTVHALHFDGLLSFSVVFW